MAWSDWPALPLQRVDMMLARTTKPHPGAAEDLENDIDCSLLHILWKSFELGMLVLTTGWAYSISTLHFISRFQFFHNYTQRTPVAKDDCNLLSVGLLIQLHRDTEAVAHDAWWLYPTTKQVHAYHTA